MTTDDLKRLRRTGWMETKVGEIEDDTVQLTITCCEYKTFSMEHLTEKQIKLLRKRVGKRVEAVFGYDPDTWRTKELLDIKAAAGSSD